MALQAGTRIGPFEVNGQIGAGGIGEVYRATDINLTRQVAIKVLPDTFANDPERLARVERALTALNPSQHRADPWVGEIRRHPRADGRYVAFVAMTQNVRSLWLRSLETLEFRGIPGTGQASAPFWSPDSRFVAFFAEETLKKVPIDGGFADRGTDGMMMATSIAAGAQFEFSTPRPLFASGVDSSVGTRRRTHTVSRRSDLRDGTAC